MDPPQVAVQFRYLVIGKTGGLVEPIDVLGDASGQAVEFPQADDRKVGPVWLSVDRPSQYSTLMHSPRPFPYLGVFEIAVNREVGGINAGPQTVWPSEIRNARFRRNPGSAEHQDLLGTIQHLRGSGDWFLHRSYANSSRAHRSTEKIGVERGLPRPNRSSRKPGSTDTPTAQVSRESQVSMTIGDTGAAIGAAEGGSRSDAELPEQTNQLGAALQELAHSLDQRLLETEQLGRITTQINQGLLLDEILDGVFDSFHGVIPYNRIGFSLVGDEGKSVVARWARTDLEEMYLGAGFRAPLEGSSLHRILATGEPRIINDLESYLESKPDSQSTRLIVAEGLRSSLTCPLIVNGQPVGFMFFSSSSPNRYSSDHVSVFRSIAAQLSVIVEKGRLASDLDAKKQEVEQQNQDLRRLDTVKSRFLGMVAHDLRNPIASIQMAAELLADPEAFLDSGERQAFLSDINRQAGYMVDLIDDLLDVTKIEAGRLDLRKEMIDLDEFLGDAVRRHANLAVRKGITVTLASRHEGTVEADRKRLRQVLDNLISNAVKFSPTGSAVEVGGRHEQGSWIVEVTDHGPGLTDADRQAVFEYFTTLSAQPTGGENSTGLGMAITRRVVEAHGGEVGVDSRIGVGSTFWFSIPDEVIRSTI